MLPSCADIWTAVIVKVEVWPRLLSERPQVPNTVLKQFRNLRSPSVCQGAVRSLSQDWLFDPLILKTLLNEHLGNLEGVGLGFRGFIVNLGVFDETEAPNFDHRQRHGSPFAIGISTR